LSVEKKWDREKRFAVKKNTNGKERGEKGAIPRGGGGGFKNRLGEKV